MKLSVIIVNYNVKYYLEQCLRSVQKALCGIDAEVIVIDNHSHDGSIEYLSPRFPDYTFISSNHNLGFARANNRAIGQSKGEYVLLLNPDTVVSENALHTVVHFMNCYPDAGAAGVRMVKVDGSDALEEYGQGHTLVQALKPTDFRLEAGQFVCCGAMHWKRWVF